MCRSEMVEALIYAIKLRNLQISSMKKFSSMLMEQKPGLIDIHKLFYGLKRFYLLNELAEITTTTDHVLFE